MDGDADREEELEHFGREGRASGDAAGQLPADPGSDLGPDQVVRDPGLEAQPPGDRSASYNFV